jgi:flagellar basal-body rod modification protein FlgD
MLAGADLDPKMFMKLLVTQMKKQNPMDPMSNSEIVSQMSQLATVEGMNSLEGTFTDMLKLARANNGVGLVGKDVAYTMEGSLREGTVDSVVLSDEEVKVRIGEDTVKLDAIKKVS